MFPKYIYGTPENRAFLAEQADALIEFGRKFPSPHGSSFYLGDDGTPLTDRNRETWITGRMAHSYVLGKHLGKEGCDELVDAALKGLQGELMDRENGGWFPGITAGGKHLPDKQCYAHAFVILAASSALTIKRSGSRELLDLALEVFDRFFWDEKEGLARDTWNTEFTICDPYRGVNANMHSVEAFLSVADVTGNEEYRKRAGRIIDRVVSWAENNEWRIPEHFTIDWKPDLARNREKPDDQFKPYGATPGHGIEWARLITQWACSALKENAPADSGGRNRQFYIDAAQNLYRRAIADAWNTDGGEGLVYTTDWTGSPVVHDRMHWTLAEAINTSATLLKVTGNSAYAEDYALFMKYLDEKVIDHRYGSWYHQLDGRGRVLDTVWPGKPDVYHALQAMLIPYCRTELSISMAVQSDPANI